MVAPPVAGVELEGVELEGVATGVVVELLIAVTVNPPARVPLWLSEFVTTTLALPAVPAPVVHVIDVKLTTTTDVHATPPIVTVAPAKKPEPMIVTLTPPVVAPLAGLIEDTVGAAM